MLTTGATENLDNQDDHKCFKIKFKMYHRQLYIDMGANLNAFPFIWKTDNNKN